MIICVPGPPAIDNDPTVNAKKKLVYLIVDFACFSGGNVSIAF